jgi:hypothetical protein
MRRKQTAFAVVVVTCFAACSERAANKGAPTRSSADAQAPSDAGSPSSDAESPPDAHTPEAATPFTPGLQYQGSLALEKVQ